jgi:hypothetical protein
MKTHDDERGWLDDWMNREPRSNFEKKRKVGTTVDLEMKEPSERDTFVEAQVDSHTETQFLSILLNSR